jgi:hypothetical protein
VAIDLALTITTIKSIAGVAKAAGKIELYTDIIGLQQTILELIADNTRSVEDNARLAREAVLLRERIASLESAVAVRQEMTFRNEAYWRVRSERPDDGPFCPKCYDGEGKTARMTDRGHGFTCCVVCEHCYGRSGSSGPQSF